MYAMPEEVARLDDQAKLKMHHQKYADKYGLDDFLDFLAEQFNDHAPLSRGEARMAYDLAEIMEAQERE